MHTAHERLEKLLDIHIFHSFAQQAYLLVDLITLGPIGSGRIDAEPGWLFVFILPARQPLCLQDSALFPLVVDRAAFLP